MHRIHKRRHEVAVLQNKKSKKQQQNSGNRDIRQNHIQERYIKKTSKIIFCFLNKTFFLDCGTEYMLPIEMERLGNVMTVPCQEGSLHSRWIPELYIHNSKALLSVPRLSSAGARD